MTRVVLDTNVLISAFLFGGKPRRLVRLAETGCFVPLTSIPLRDETRRILADKFGWSAREISKVCEPFWRLGESVEPDFALTACPDPEDNRVLERAVAGSADCIVTGDRVLLRMNPFEEIEILGVDVFLSLLEVPGSEEQ
jgi:putative PIN family toxin of toxin-antitoxin system